MTATFVACQRHDNEPLYYACWLTAGGVTVKACGATRGRAYWEALILAYTAARKIRRG